MKFLKILFFQLSLVNFSFSQGLFQLNGEIKNPTERKVLITIYRDWVGEEEEYELKLDQQNHFFFSVDLSKIAYLDFYYGDTGFHYWIIEPKDQINLKFDAKDFWHTANFSGNGYEKWLYYNQNYHAFEEKNDLEKDLEKWRKLLLSEFFKKIDDLESKKLAFLKETKNLSPEFSETRKADIIGEMQNIKIEHFYGEKYINWSETQIKKQLKFDSLGVSVQTNSLEYGSAFQNLVELFSSKIAENKKKDLTEKEKYELIKSFYVRGQIGRELSERLLAVFLKSEIELNGINEKIIELVNDYIGFAENRDFKNYLQKRISFAKTFLKGSPAKLFILRDSTGNEVSLSSLKGKVVYLDFWASWCGPCIYDMKFMETVRNHFKEREDLVFVYISLDKEEEWREALKQNQVKGINLRTTETSDIVKNYGVSGIPAYFLIDKNGNFAVSQVADPSIEEGQALIKQIEEVLK